MPDTASGIIAKLRFVDITVCDGATQEAVRKLRNHLQIRRFMYNPHEISVEEHARWIVGLEGVSDRRFYVVFSGEDIAGTVNWSSRGQQAGELYWGFYVNPGMTGHGIGTAMLRQFLDMIFADGETGRVIGEALQDNAASQALHKRLGFVEQGLRDVEDDNGETRIAVRFALTRGDWLEIATAQQQGK